MSADPTAEHIDAVARALDPVVFAVEPSTRV